MRVFGVLVVLCLEVPYRLTRENKRGVMALRQRPKQ